MDRNRRSGFFQDNLKTHRTWVLLLIFFLCCCQSQVSSVPALKSIACRTEAGIYLPFDKFELHACAKCYFYMPDWAFKSRFIYLGDGRFYDSNSTYLSNETATLSMSFQSLAMANKWQQCCADAVACCLENLAIDSFDSQQSFLNVNLNANAVNNQNHDSASCPKTWDGWTCWPNDITIGLTVQQACPAHIYWRMTAPPCRGYVTKTCTDEGNWFSIEGREWSNYTNCARDDIYLRRLRYSIVTHLISVAFILPALFIFNYYRQLSTTPRIRLHKHLFTCLLLYAILSSLLKLSLLQTETETQYGTPPKSEDADAASDDGDTSSGSSSSTYCLLLSLCLRYFRSTTYLWMFNEAFYLHQLIKKAFTQPPVGPLITVAYGLPFLYITCYVVCRAFIGFEGAVSSPLDLGDSVTAQQDVCWLLPARDSWKEWVINGPNLCILLVNCLLLLPILSEIYKKAAAAPSASPQNVQRNLLRQPTATGNSLSKASFMVSLRAATFLLPLYGLHYLVIVYRPDFNVCWFSELYHYSSLTLDGLQGTLVAILFCFANNEVRQLLRRSLCSKRDGTLFLTEIVAAPH